MYLKEVYKSKKKEIQTKLGVKNVMEVPILNKVTINMGVGEAINDKKHLDNALEQMALIAGQKPQITYAKKSISTFKIREGFPIGCKVTLRKDKMWAFLDRLIHIAIPRIRDFRGLNSNSFDAFGNFSLGIKEQIIFPEIDFDKIDTIRGMDISITTSARNKEEGLTVLKSLGFPFKK